MSLDSYHSIESLPPRGRVERQRAPVGRIEHLRDNTAPSGLPLKEAVKTPLDKDHRMGLRYHPIDKVWKYHRGVDISSGGKVCLATSAGIIVEIGHNSGGAGNYVVINHGNGFVTRYMHLGSIDKKVKIGATVGNRQQIGITGDTGKVKGAHLHYEVLYLDYTVPYVSSSSLSVDKWIDPETTFVPGRQDKTSSIRTLAGTRKNLKTRKSDKTNTHEINEYLLSQLYAVEDEENIIDDDNITVTESNHIQDIEPRKVIYRVDEGLAETTNQFRYHPKSDQVLSLLQLFRSNTEFDLGGYSVNEQARITNNLAKLANYIIKTAREYKKPEEYTQFVQSLYDFYGISHKATNYTQDLNVILDICKMVRGSNGGGGRSGELSSSNKSVVGAENMKKMIIDEETRLNIDKILKPLMQKDALIESLGLGNYKNIPLIIEILKGGDKLIFDTTNKTENVIQARKYYLLSCKAAQKLMNEFYVPKSSERGTYIERQKQYNHRMKDFADAMAKLYSQSITQPPIIENDMKMRASIIAKNNETIAKLEKIINR